MEHQFQTPVAADRNWQKRVHDEIVSSKAWHDKWGFLSGGEERKESMDKFLAANRNCQSTVALNLRETTRRKRSEAPASSDSLDNFVHTYLAKSAGHGMRALPKEEFQRPTLTSHTVGWGNNLERFGPLKLNMR